MSLFQTQMHEQKAMASGQQTTLQIPVGSKIMSIPLVFLTGAGVPVTEAQIRAEIGNIRLTINGRDIVNASAVQILDLYEFLGSKVSTPAAVAGVVELNVGRLLFVDPMARDAFGIGTQDVANIQVQITAGTLSAIASVQVGTERMAVGENMGTIASFQNYPVAFNATGDHTYDTLPRDLNSAYLALMVDDGASGAISHSEVRFNSVTLRERLPSAMNALYCSNKGFAQPAGYFVHAFADGGLSGILPMPGVTDLRVITTFGTAPGAAGYNISTLKLVQPNAAGPFKL